MTGPPCDGRLGRLCGLCRGALEVSCPERFATMRELRATDALAFDGDFSAAGFTELRA